MTGRGTLLDVNRSRWTTHANFKIMCDLTHEKILEARIAIGCPEAEIFNNDGKIVDEKCNLVGIPKKYEMTLPNYLLMVDEVSWF